MELELNKFFESVFKESRTTNELSQWWFEWWSKFMFDTREKVNNKTNEKIPEIMPGEKKISAKIDFFPMNSLYKDFEEHFVTVLYDESKDGSLKDTGLKTSSDLGLKRLRNEIQDHFESKMNKFAYEELPELGNITDEDFNKMDGENQGKYRGLISGFTSDEKRKYSIKYGDEKFGGPKESFSEFILDVYKERPNIIEGNLITTYKTHDLKMKERPWRIGMEGIEAVYPYHGVDNHISQDDSPYVDPGISVREDGIHTVPVECCLRVELITNLPDPDKSDK